MKHAERPSGRRRPRRPAVDSIVLASIAAGKAFDPVVGGPVDFFERPVLGMVRIDLQHPQPFAPVDREVDSHLAHAAVTAGQRLGYLQRRLFDELIVGEGRGGSHSLHFPQPGQLVKLGALMGVCHDAIGQRHFSYQSRAGPGSIGLALHHGADIVWLPFDSVERNAALDNQLSEFPGFPDMFVHLIEISERAGNLFAGNHGGELISAPLAAAKLMDSDAERADIRLDIQNFKARSHFLQLLAGKIGRPWNKVRRSRIPAQHPAHSKFSPKGAGIIGFDVFLYCWHPA
ncbi:hypothetical protein BN871_CF_00110 [Paenibacillus sp. P22]|nr:hypothetical protein BN871_CF_00110 [Paenibacillus sp. P22]